MPSFVDATNIMLPAGPLNAAVVRSSVASAPSTDEATMVNFLDLPFEICTQVYKYRSQTVTLK